MDLEETVNALAPKVLAYCRGRLRRADTAQDVAQSALAALVRRWRRSGPPDSPEAFAFAIARRRAWRASAMERLGLPIESQLFLRSPEPDASHVVETRSELTAVRSAMERLSGKERDAILLIAVGELSMSQAARVTGVSDSAFKMRLSRARKKLRGLLS